MITRNNALFTAVEMRVRQALGATGRPQRGRSLANLSLVPSNSCIPLKFILFDQIAEVVTASYFPYAVSTRLIGRPDFQSTTLAST